MKDARSAKRGAHARLTEIIIRNVFKRHSKGMWEGDYAHVFLL
jgi:hypothetical protein